MPLVAQPPPRGIEKVLNASVSELVGHGALALPTRAEAAVGTPLPAYALGADDIASGKGLAAARQVGWMATLSNAGEVLGTIELVPAKRRAGADATLQFGSFTRGALHRGLATALERAAKEAGRTQVEAAILRVPALYLLALWLRGKEGDRLVPIAPAPAPLKAGEAYPAERALAMLAEAAKAVLQGDDARN